MTDDKYREIALNTLMKHYIWSYKLVEIVDIVRELKRRGIEIKDLEKDYITLFDTTLQFRWHYWLFHDGGKAQ
jgi:hypothetical protein